MADAPGGGPLKKEFGGQPVWVWLVGAGVVLLGYWYFTKKSSASAAPAGSGGGGGQEKSSSNINETITDFQNPPGQGGGGGGGGTSEGPEREWLENKTGSQHPWTYLARHHERIEVGPHGSRKIIKDK